MPAPWKISFWLFCHISSFALAGAVAAQQQNPRSWRLVQVRQPLTGANLPALLEVADLTRSDPGLIGMMVRCSENSGQNELVPVFVVAEPLPPRATPQVTLQASGPDVTVEAHVIPTGAGISLPFDIRAKMLGPWRNASELNITIKNEDMTIKGMIRLNGLSEGLNQLAAICRKN